MPLLLALLAACGDAPPDDTASCGGQDTGVQVGAIEPQCQCQEARFDIGTGEGTFEELPEGGDLMMVNGPQGGWHVLSAVRVFNTRDVVSITTRAVHEATDTPVTQDQLFRVQLVEGSDPCVGTFPNMYLYLDVSAFIDGEADTPPELLSCETLRLEMTITDTGGRLIEQRLRVRATPDPDNVASGLAEACE